MQVRSMAYMTVIRQCRCADQNRLVRAQTFMAGYAPAPVFAAMSGVAAVGAVLCGMRNLGKLPDRGDHSGCMAVLA